MNDKNQHIIDWELVASILDDSANSEEKQSFEQWLSEGNNQHYFDEIKTVWQKTGDISYCFNDETNNAWNRVSSLSVNKRTKPGVKKVMFRTLQIAAVIAILLLAGKFLLFPDKLEVYSENQILNDYILPDESTVSLNKNTRLTFYKNFKKDKRELWLQGEAFFDVKRNPNRPFIIHAQKSVFEVLGTSFNIKAYEGDSIFELNVKTGQVKFTSEETSESVMVKKDQSITFNLKNNRISENNGIDLNYMAWKTKMIVFNKTTLSEVIKCLESVYNVKIIFKNDELKSLMFSADFNNQPLDKILKVIELTFDIEVKRENGVIELYKPDA